jgi:Chaperone of endosialidase
MKTTILSTNCIHRPLGPSALLFVSLLIGCFAISPMALAVVPAPDGDYPGSNTAEGQNALLSLTTGGFNTAVGWFSLKSLNTGSFDTAIGAGALVLNTADQNTATGAGSLLSNTTGPQNTANGAFALFSNTEGSFNTAIGGQALFSNTTGNINTADGASSLFSNTTGTFNTAVGRNALFSNITGNLNTAIGFEALTNNTAGSNNTALGVGAGSAVTTASNVICIGANFAGADVTNTCFIGNIRGVTTQNADAIPVVIDSAGQLGTASSSARFKKEIKPMNKASEAILALKPVMFQYKSDPSGTAQFGLIAEEVTKVNPDLVVRDKEGKPYSVRYDAVNAMLLNEFLKEHAKVEQLKKDFESKIAQQQKQIEALAAGLQKVSAELAAASPSDGGLELNKFATGRIRRGGVAPQTVKNTD